MHYVGDADGTEDYRMMSLDFSPQGKLGVGPTAQISCGRYIPSDWQEAIAYRPLPGLQVRVTGALPSWTCPARLSGSTRPAGTRNRSKASGRWASSS